MKDTQNLQQLCTMGQRLNTLCLGVKRSKVKVMVE